MRSEFQDIENGFDLMPALNAGTAVVVNSAGIALGNTVGRLALAGDFTTTGNFSVVLAAAASVILSLPATSGTLATVSGNLGTPTVLVGTNITGDAAGLTVGNATTAGFATTAGSASTVTTNANLTGVITSIGNATSIASQTGTGTKFVVDNGPTLIAPVLGIATATSLNGLAITSTTGTLTLASGKIFSVDKTLTLDGIDGTIMTFPATSATIARTDAANTFTGVQTFSTPIASTSVAAMTATVGGGVPTPPNNTTTFLRGDGTFAAPSTASGTVTSVSVVTANGISGSVATSTTTPAITLTLGAITPTTVNGVTISSSSGTLTLANSKTLIVSNSLTLAGTDSTVLTFPTTTATIARTDAGQTFTGTQTFGALVYSTLNGNTWATGTGTLSIAAGKILTASNTLTLAGTDATVMIFPTTSATIARTDSAQTFTGVQTFVAPILGTPTSVTLTNATGLPAASVVAGALANGMTATTQSSADNSTKLATTAYADAVAVGINVKRTIFTSTGANTFTPTKTGTYKITLIGGGAAGGTGGGISQAGGGAGGAGATCIVWATLTATTGYTVTVGVAAASTTAVVGATTYTAGTGSSGATGAAGGSGGVGGTATNGDINISGGPGEDGQSPDQSGIISVDGGNGGSSSMGGGGLGGNNTSGGAALVYGAGGGGGSASNVGGTGKQGIAIIEWVG